MSVKIHIAESPEPLTEHTVLDALCGDAIPQANFVAFFDSSAGLSVSIDQLFEDLNALGVCRKCISRSVSERYIYAIREAGE